MKCCRTCGVELTSANWTYSLGRSCRTCKATYRRERAAIERSKRAILLNCFKCGKPLPPSKFRYAKQCDECRRKRARKATALYRKRHPEFRVLNRQRIHDYVTRLREEIYRHYSPELKCVRCGFSDIRALSLDHINGGGTAERRKVGWGVTFWKWIKANNFPSEYQVLCMNCNNIKRVENHEWGKTTANNNVL